MIDLFTVSDAILFVRQTRFKLYRMYEIFAEDKPFILRCRKADLKKFKISLVIFSFN